MSSAGAATTASRSALGCSAHLASAAMAAPPGAGSRCRCRPAGLRGTSTAAAPAATRPNGSRWPAFLGAPRRALSPVPLCAHRLGQSSGQLPARATGLARGGVGPGWDQSGVSLWSMWSARRQELSPRWGRLWSLRRAAGWPPTGTPVAPSTLRPRWCGPFHTLSVSQSKGRFDIFEMRRKMHLARAMWFRICSRINRVW